MQLLFFYKTMGETFNNKFKLTALQYKIKIIHNTRLNQKAYQTEFIVSGSNSLPLFLTVVLKNIASMPFFKDMYFL